MSAGPSPVPPPPPPPPSTWSLADWVDFEILLAQEEPGTEPAWLRAWEKHRGPASSPPHDLPRRGLFRRWLEFRRADPTLRLPGEALASGWRSLSVLAGIAGVLLGGTLTGTLLHYRGTEPVNVAWFLVATLGLQLVLLVGTLGVAALRRTTGLARELRPLRHALTGLAWLCSAGLRRLPGERREELRARVANLLRKREIYGSLATWPILVVTQTFAVGYNVGILVVLLAHVAATDLAFGWQSTLELGPDAVHRIVSAVASPWAWFAPNPNPTLPQIVGSRFSYADGMSGLDRAALAAWWPFLAYAVAFYGAGLRAAALAGAWIGQRRALDRWAFDHEGCNALARRLTGPAIHACADTAALRIPETPALPGAPAPTRKACLALVATDLPPAAGLAERFIERALRLPTAATIPVQIDHPSGNADALAALSAPATAGSPVVVVVPAHRAPIKAIGLFLQRVVDASPPPRDVVVLLVGRPTDNAEFRPVPDSELGHWRNLLAIQRLPIGLERLHPA